ncbi:hypothetical protein B0H10DRAFT_1744087, partial [Mycena sp. CBHHK59/15]
PKGYLFLCPLSDLQTDTKSFKHPECAAYWSLDMYGTKPLIDKQARALGFPQMHLGMFREGRSFGESVYMGLRKFHEGKGFHPDTQDVALNLGYPLYRL